MKDLFQFAEKLIWPIVVVFVATKFRQEIRLILLRITSISLAGSMVKLAEVDEDNIKTAERIRLSTREPKEQAKQLLKENAITNGEFRILRGLIAEKRGRSFSVASTSMYYSSALASLKAKHLIRRDGNVYFLTSTGLETLKLHLVNAFNSK